MEIFKRRSMFEQPRVETQEERAKREEKERLEKEKAYAELFKDLHSVAAGLGALSERELKELAADYSGGSARDVSAIVEFAEMLKKYSV